MRWASPSSQSVAWNVLEHVRTPVFIILYIHTDECTQTGSFTGEDYRQQHLFYFLILFFFCFCLTDMNPPRCCPVLLNYPFPGSMSFLCIFSLVYQERPRVNLLMTPKDLLLLKVGIQSYLLHTTVFFLDFSKKE